MLSDENVRWNKPMVGSGAVWDEGCQCFRSGDYGWSTFISHGQLNRRSFLKNNDLIVTADFNGENPNYHDLYFPALLFHFNQNNTLCRVMFAFLSQNNNFES